MGLQSKAEACGDALRTDDTAFPQNLLPPAAGPLSEAPTGEVVESAGGDFKILFGGKTISARRAVSCLIEPQASDTVALLGTQAGVFITDVLVRPDMAVTAIRLNTDRGDGTPADIEISAGNLKLDVSEALEASGKQLDFRFDSLLMTGNQLAMIGGRLMTSMKEIVTNARKQLASFEMTATSAKNRIDRIVETDQLRAGSVQTQADTVALTQAGSSLTVAKEDVRLDGKRISMG